MPFNRKIEEPLGGPLTEGDGHGIGSTLDPDVSVEEERRQIERGVRERRGPDDPDRKA